MFVTFHTIKPHQPAGNHARDILARQIVAHKQASAIPAA
jgi:hypothetical protein